MNCRNLRRLAAWSISFGMMAPPIWAASYTVSPARYTTYALPDSHIVALDASTSPRLRGEVGAFLRAGGGGVVGGRGVAGGGRVGRPRRVGAPRRESERVNRPPRPDPLPDRSRV